MKLFELFEPRRNSMARELKNAILDILTPLSSHGAKEVSLQRIVDDLRQLDFGIELTPETLKDYIDPDHISFVTGVDDTTVYMNGAAAPEQSDMGDGEPQEPVDPINDEAKKQAMDKIDPPKKIRPTL